MYGWGSFGDTVGAIDMCDPATKPATGAWFCSPGSSTWVDSNGVPTSSPDIGTAPVLDGTERTLQHSYKLPAAASSWTDYLTSPIVLLGAGGIALWWLFKGAR